MASVQNIGINGERNKADNERMSQGTGMSKENSPLPLNRTPGRDSYWFAYGRTEDASPGNISSDTKTTAAEQKDREEKMRAFREHQEEQRLRKLQGMEHQFLLAKKHREQQEEERRRRIEEARVREMERRQQVEERKRQIWEAEQERKEAILRRNMEREARIEARRNAHRMAQSFAFGSSTPRTFDLDLAAIGLGRNTNTSVLMSSVGRRSEERDMGPPRATSACSLDRKFESSCAGPLRDFPRSPALDLFPGALYRQIALQQKSSCDIRACLSMADRDICDRSLELGPLAGRLVGLGCLVGEDCMSRSMVSLSSSSSSNFRGRRRTDITPTPNRERSITPRGKDSSRSPSRPVSSMSGTSDVSATSSSVSAVNMRPRPAPRRPRPYSVAGSLTQITKKEPDRMPRSHERSATTPRAKSACRESEEAKRPLSAPRKPLPPPKSSELLAKAKPHPVPIKDNLRKMNKTVNKSVVIDKTTAAENKDGPSKEKTVTDKIDCKRKEEPAKQEEEEETQLNSAVTSPMTDSEMMLVSSDDSKTAATSDVSQSVTESEPPQSEQAEQKATTDQNIPSEAQEKAVVEGGGSSKPRITSEEEARAALAEKRRLAREQAEREVEMEKQRLEAIRCQEEEQRLKEEQEQQRMEEEQIRLAELHHQMEQEKLAKAIEEQQQREREEQERREEETRQRVEKEEQERKAREEAEKQRVELEEKLRKEEEERAERKRRVEQIMARTRGKTATQSSISSVTPVAPPSVTDIPNGTTEEAQLPDILNTAIHSAQRNGAFANGKLGANEDVSPQSNGYSSHEDMSCTTSPEESTDILIDIQQQRTQPLVNVNNENFLIRVDDVNSNLFGFSDSLQKKQDTQVTDLLS